MPGISSSPTPTPAWHCCHWQWLLFPAGLASLVQQQGTWQLKPSLIWPSLSFLIVSPDTQGLAFSRLAYWANTEAQGP